MQRGPEAEQLSTSASDVTAAPTATSWPPAGRRGAVRVRLADGREILGGAETLEELPDGTFRLTLAEYAAAAAPAVAPRAGAAEGAAAVAVASTGTRAVSDGVVVPVVEERLEVGRRVVETGRLRVRKFVREEEERVDQTLLREELVVERVPVERFVDGPQPVRQEGDTTVFPVVEEVVVVEKKLMLREEVRVRRRMAESREAQTVTLRREEVRVERVPAGPHATDAAAEPAPGIAG